MSAPGGPPPRRLHVGVVGPGERDATDAERATAAQVGAALARAGAVVVCGGLGGVMAGAARGARDAGGDVLGVLPGDDPRAGNPLLTHVVATGLGELRDAVLVRSCDALVAVGVNPGTAIEVLLARGAGRRVLAVGFDGLVGAGRRLDDAVPAPGWAEAVEAALAAAAEFRRGG